MHAGGTAPNIAAIVGIEAPSPAERGFQIGQKAITIQWQDGKQVVIWPDEVASGKPLNECNLDFETDRFPAYCNPWENSSLLIARTHDPAA